MMDRDQALQKLGLADALDLKKLRENYDTRRAQLTDRLANASTDGLRQKYQTALGDLVAAYETLKAAPELPGGSALSRTQIKDLPGVGPSYTSGGEALASSAALSAGEVLLDRYEILQLIGQGGMGSVYRAFDRTRQEEIALKVLLPQLVASEQARERFISEGKISSRLSHPNIVNVFDVQRAGDLYFLTMELLRGQTLREMMQKAAQTQPKKPGGGAVVLSVDKAIEIARAVGAALTYAHRFTIHRDVKPENIWVEEGGGYKLMDFGIARLLTGSQLTMTSTAIGSAYYMAPEALKDSKRIDGRADEYSLAVVLYEAITGDLPTGRAKSIADRVRSVPSGFSRAIDRALETQPDSRFPDVETFVQNLSSRTFTLRDKPWLAYGAAAVVACTVVLGLILAGPRMKGLLPDPAAADREKVDAVESQAAVAELMRRIETRQREVDQIVRDSQSMEERLADRVNMARSDGERENLKAQLTTAKAAVADAEMVRSIIGEKLLSIENVAALKGTEAVGEAALRDGHFAQSASAFHDARTKAEKLLGESVALPGAVAAKTQLSFLLQKARDAISSNGGDANVILQDGGVAANQALIDLSAGNATEAVSQFSSASTEVSQEVVRFLEKLISSYSLIAQRKMESNELETAEAALTRAKTLKQREREFE